MPRNSFDADAIEIVKRKLSNGNLALPVITSGLGAFGALALNVETRDAGNPTGTASVVIYDALSGGVTVTPPAAADHLGRLLFVHNADAAETVTVLGSVLATGQTAIAYSDGTSWTLLLTTGT